jgi:hypothetical protein
MSIAVLQKLCSQIPWCELAVLEPTVELALEIAREGREGRRIGTLFTLGNAEAVLAASRPLILDPLAAHAPARTHITDPNLRGTIKELAQLDGAFVISEAGTFVAEQAQPHLPVAGCQPADCDHVAMHQAGAQARLRALRALPSEVSRSSLVKDQGMVPRTAQARACMTIALSGPPPSSLPRRRSRNASRSLPDSDAA